MEQQRYPKGHFIGLGVAFGMFLGLPIGSALGNVALGPAIGAAVGIATGIVLEKKNNPNPRPLTKEEKRVRKRNVLIIAGLGIVALVIVTSLY